MLAVRFYRKMCEMRALVCVFVWGARACFRRKWEHTQYRYGTRMRLHRAVHEWREPES